MTYVMSDMHGCFDNYKTALETISFKDTDTLYVLGDVVDRGAEPLKILFDMMVRPNVFPLAGNHEVMAAATLPSLVEFDTPEKCETMPASLKLDILDWSANGGTNTITRFRELTAEKQEQIIEYLEEFESYVELTVKGQDYVLCHAGITDFDPEKPLDEYNFEQFIKKRCDYTKVYFPDKILVTGHTPTRTITGKEDVVYRENNHLAIDCACCYGGKLAVVCLETGEEFYC